MSTKLEISNFEEISNLVDESINSFVPSTNDKFSTIKEMLENWPKENINLFCFKNNSKKIGYISLLTDGTEIASIGPMFISKAFQGKGFGKQQVEELLKWCKANGFIKIKTKTWGKNIGSRKIFESLDFITTEVKENARVNGDSSVKYEKNLN